MTKYYVDKTKSKKPVFVLIGMNGCLRGVFENAGDAQDEKEKLENGDSFMVIGCHITKDKGKHKDFYY